MLVLGTGDAAVSKTKDLGLLELCVKPREKDNNPVVK
jgi:hypothetical protein